MGEVQKGLLAGRLLLGKRKGEIGLRKKNTKNTEGDGLQRKRIALLAQ